MIVVAFQHGAFIRPSRFGKFVDYFAAQELEEDVNIDSPGNSRGHTEHRQPL